MTSPADPPPAPASRPLTDFEHVLLSVIVQEPRSAYGLKKMFSSSPASVYQPSPGALHPALRRLEARGLLVAEQQVSSGRRERRLYRATAAGQAMNQDWLRQPVNPGTVGSDLGLHLMRFAQMEGRLPRAEVLRFLDDLAQALGGFVGGMEKLVAGGTLPNQHGELAVRHGIAVHRASLEWARSARAALAGNHPAENNQMET
ncbi:MAG: PadR family transcriptional regulator [Actinobacteria bacterium]|nr:PadR family transcriptional regulator [Actinomycetota bacterium]